MKNKKQIIFRADGNSKTGLGHLFRLFAVVEMIKKQYDYVFYTKSDSTISIIPDQYNLKLLPDNIDFEHEVDWISRFYNPDKTIIIADGYQFNSLYQKRVKENGFKLIYIDDLAKEHMYADIVVNHSPHIKPKDFKTEPYTQLALGTNYAILRRSFLNEVKKKRIIGKLDTAFVCFGGADPYDLSYKAVNALIKLPKFKVIHVVLGGAYRHKEIFQLERKISGRLILHKNLNENELINVMKLSHFAIAPASTILYELCCVKMPILSGYFVDNQELIYKGFLKHNAIYMGGNLKDYQDSDFVTQIKMALNESNFNSLLEAQGDLFDDKISRRHLDLIKKLCYQ